MTENYTSKGAVLAGIKAEGGEDTPIEQLRFTVAALIDSLEFHASQSTDRVPKEYFDQAQRMFEMGTMLAVKGFYLNQRLES